MTLEDAMVGAVDRLRANGYGPTTMQHKNSMTDEDTDGDGKLEPSEDLGAGQAPGNLSIEVVGDDGNPIITVTEMAFFDVKPVVDDVYVRLLEIVVAAEGAG